MQNPHVLSSMTYIFQAGDQKAAVSQKICPAESGAGRKTLTAAGYHRLVESQFTYPSHCLVSSVWGREVAATEGLQGDNKKRQDYIHIFVHCSKLISNHKKTFGKFSITMSADT